MIKCFFVVIIKLKTMVKNNPFIFCMFFAGIFMSNLMFTYFFGNIKYTAIKYNSPSFSIENIKEDAVDIPTIERELSDSESIYYFSLIDKKSLEKNTDSCLNTDEYLKTRADTELYIATCKDMNRFYTSQGEMKSLDTADTVIIPDLLMKSGGTFPELLINEKSYTVTGLTSSRFFLVSQDTFSNNKLLTSKIEINLSPDTTEKECEVFREKLSTIFNENFNVLETTNASINSEVTGVIVQATIVYFLSIFALLFIMANMFEQSAYELSIYELLGATRRKIIFILSLLQLVILVIVGIFSQLIHALLYGALFSKINVYEFIYSFEMYAQSLLITVVFVLLFIILYLCTKMKKYAIVNCRKFIT